MKPIGNNSEADATDVAEPDEQHAIAASATSARSRIRSSNTGRFEDIIGATPVRATSIAANPAPVLDIALPQAIADVVAAAPSFEAARKAFAQLLQNRFGGSYFGWLHASTGKIGQAVRIESLAGDTEAPAECPEVCVSALAARSTVSKSDKTNVIFATPVRGANGDCLVAVVPAGAESQVANAVELIGARLSELLVFEQLNQSASDSLNAAALVELISVVSSESSQKASLQRLADELQRHLSAEEVFIGVCRSSQPACSLFAVSNTPELDRFSESTRLTEAVMQESIARSAASVWPACDETNRHALLAHQQFANHERVAAVVATPLRSESGEIVGSIAATFSESVDTASSAMKFLHAGSRAIGTTVKAVQRTHRSPLDVCKRKLAKLFGSQKCTTAAVAVGLASAALLIPMDYRVRCETELQPVSRRYIAAPFDAPLETCNVDPGDIVEQDQVLAVLDGRELRWEAAGLRADIGKASKEHNTHLSQKDFGDAAIARHEIDRLQNRSELLSQRERNLEIRSPINGVIVAGDLREREGVPLESGQSLFEVAPLDQLVMEVAIPEEDIRHVQVGMSISLQLDSMPAETITATVLRIHPKAELREHENVFIAEAEISNDELLLRPGMKGSSLVSTGRRAIGWNLFHKPVAHVVGWLGW